MTMASKASYHVLRDDYKQAHGARISMPELLAGIRHETGKAGFKVLSEWAPLAAGPGRLTLEDYVFYRLYDDAAHDQKSRSRFISETRYKRLISGRLDMTWAAATEDKWLMYSLLAHHGVPVPNTLAIVDAASRSYGRLPVLRSAEDLASFLHSDAEFPLFLKPVTGVGSSGALLLRGVVGNDVETANSERLAMSDLFSTAIGTDPYLIQTYVENHSDIRSISSHLATVRCYNFFEDGKLRVESTLIKLVGGNNIADNYWREGNFLAAIDPTCGKLTRAVTGSGFTLRALEAHPVSGRVFSEVQLPFWEEVVALNEACARLYSPIEYSSTDIAITPQGPTVIEANIGGAFTLPQLASGRGFLSDAVAGFFRIPLKPH